VEEVADGVAAMSVEDSSASAETPAVPEGTPLAASEVSTLLSASLLQALSTNPPSFPIPSSQLYSAHVLPSRPAYIPLARRDDVVINRSEWKKLAKWMKELSKDGVLKIKESKGEAVVTG
jgi:translation initiation factor 2D